MNSDIFVTYALPVIVAAMTAIAGYIGTQIKRLYEKYVNDKVKQDVVRTCVKAVEQLYHDFGGYEKYKKAKEGVLQMLSEKGIIISELELEMMIESVVSEFNYGFAKASDLSQEGDTDGEH